LESAQLEKMYKGDLGGFPNGIYKITIGIYDQFDEKIVMLTFFVENQHHGNIYAAKNF
jgi:hypothetical protein